MIVTKWTNFLNFCE